MAGDALRLAAETFPLFVAAFVPLFIAIDSVSLPPIMLSLSEGLTFRQRRRMVHVAILTALLVGLVFLLFGQAVLTLMGISVGSFAIAGGIVLLVQAILNMTSNKSPEVLKEEMVAVVPIGTPLLSGPATITTLLLLSAQLGLPMVLAAFLANVLVAWLICLGSNRVLAVMGQGGVRAVSKVFSLLLAAIGVNLILRGLGIIGIIPPLP
jgi:multiple antibiotic resistance protein